MKRRAWFVVPLLALLAFSQSGCHYVSNRAADFSDIFQFGVGFTTENPKTGILPPSFGIYVQATNFLNLGAIYFNGASVEWDGRGLFCGPERRTRIGLLSIQQVRIDQNYEMGAENYFKKSGTAWSDRMRSPAMRWNDVPAKDVGYEEASIGLREGSPLFPRGWHYWENFNVEIGIPDPFLTHAGINLRVGFDPSEIFDLVLGVFCIDVLKNDDMTAEEFGEFIASMR